MTHARAHVKPLHDDRVTRRNQSAARPLVTKKLLVGGVVGLPAVASL